MLASPSEPPTKDGAHLFELVSLIQSSVTDIVAEYKAGGSAVPSLNSTSTVDEPFDAPEKVTMNLMRAIRTVEAACAQLCASVASPRCTLVNKSLAFEESACLNVVCNAKVADQLLDKPEGVPVKELAQKSGISADRLTRVMRLLSTKHIFREVQRNVFANNRLSIRLLSTDSCNDIVTFMSDFPFELTAHMYKALSDPTAPATMTTFEYLYGMPMFDYLKGAEGKAKARLFSNGMMGWGDATGKHMLTKVYPWNTVAASASGPITICDVGGGNGHVMLDLMRTFPKIPFKVVVQDMPSMLDQGKTLWAKGFPEALRDGMVELVPIDFFKESPVKGCDFYYLRHIIHNWSDDKCILLLSNVATAMRASPGKDSCRLLIHDCLLQHAALPGAGAVPFGLETAPTPLLPNYGAGRALAYGLDILMINLLGDAKERTVEEFSDLGTQAGLNLAHVWDAGETSILEFKLA